MNDNKIKRLAYFLSGSGNPIFAAAVAAALKRIYNEEAINAKKESEASEREEG